MKMKQENGFVRRYVIPVGYAVLVYIIWELAGTLVSHVIGKITGNWEQSLYSNYIIMLLDEILTFVIMFALFHKKVQFVRGEKGVAFGKFALCMLIVPIIQIGDDVATILSNKCVFSLLSGKGIRFFVICCAACLSIGLLEEYVWRGIVLNHFLSVWGEKKKGIYLAVLISSLCFGLCHYMNLLGGQEFADTTKQVIAAVGMGVFLAALYLKTNNLLFPALVHGLCNLSNFLMNEILGWDYSVWKYDDILQWGLAAIYFVVGIYCIYRMKIVENPD